MHMVDTARPTDFVGRAALRNAGAAPRRVVQLVLADADEMMFGGEPVYRGDRIVGSIGSARYLPSRPSLRRPVRDRRGCPVRPGGTVGAGGRPRWPEVARGAGLSVCPTDTLPSWAADGDHHDPRTNPIDARAGVSHRTEDMTMTTTEIRPVPLSHLDRFYIGGEWVRPSSESTFDVIDRRREELYFRAAEAPGAGHGPRRRAARDAFDHGPWPRLTHAERGDYLRAIAAELRDRADDLGQLWTRQSGVIHRESPSGSGRARTDLRLLRRAGADVPVRGAGHADRRRRFGLLVREPVGVVGAIIPWNAPIGLIANKVAPALHRRAARSSSRRRPRRPARPTCSPRSPRRSGCRRACSTSSPPTARSPSSSSATRGSTRSPSPARPPPAAASRRSAASASPAARSSSAASRRRSILDDIDLGAAADDARRSRVLPRPARSARR